jgi:hypothetical protein
MSIERASDLYHTGRSYAGACCMLHRATLDYTEEEGIEDRDTYVFNGPNSLAITYLLGLGLELMLKGAIVALDPGADARYLQKEIGHDLLAALDQAEHRGFASQAGNLRQLVDVLRDPYRQHWLRYERPDQFNLPDNFEQIVAILEAVEGDIKAVLDAAQKAPS